MYNDGEVNLIKIYCKHICKCHNVIPLCNYYMQIKNVFFFSFFALMRTIGKRFFFKYRIERIFRI
jgi:hypothetical protein